MIKIKDGKDLAGYVQRLWLLGIMRNEKPDSLKLRIIQKFVSLTEGGCLEDYCELFLDYMSYYLLTKFGASFEVLEKSLPSEFEQVFHPNYPSSNDPEAILFITTEFVKNPYLRLILALIKANGYIQEEFFDKMSSHCTYLEEAYNNGDSEALPF